MKYETQPYNIEDKIRQDCYNRGYEQGRKNPAEEIVKYIEKLQKQVKEYQNKIENGTLKEIPENSVVLTRGEYDELCYSIGVSREEVDRVVDIVEKDTRKETAEEILQIIKEEYDYIGNLEKIIKERYGVEVE